LNCTIKVRFVKCNGALRIISGILSDCGDGAVTQVYRCTPMRCDDTEWGAQSHGRSVPVPGRRNRTSGLRKDRLTAVGFCPKSGGNPSDHFDSRLVPFGSGRAPLSGSYRTIITSCWDAPGLNRKPPAALSQAAGRSGPAPSDSAWMGLPEEANDAYAPIREYGYLPHVERDPLPSSGPTSTARVCAVFGIVTSARQGLLTLRTTCNTRWLDRTLQ
jgi:hypothetical protein